MLTAAAICPHPPLLVPEATGGATGQGDFELNRLREACDAAAATLIGTRPDLIVLVGGADRTALHPPDGQGTLIGYGVPFTSGSDRIAELPLSLTVGRWLLVRASAGLTTGQGLTTGLGADADQGLATGHGPDAATDASGGNQMGLQAVATSTPPEDCLILGASIAALAPRVAILAMGDGPARRARGVPRAIDADADRYDKQLRTALATADAGYLADLDPAQDGDLFIAGRAAWQVLAGAALTDADGSPAVIAADSAANPVGIAPNPTGIAADPAAMDSRFTAVLRYAAAPFEVSYYVATWMLAPR